MTIRQVQPPGAPALDPADAARDEEYAAALAADNLPAQGAPAETPADRLRAAFERAAAGRPQGAEPPPVLVWTEREDGKPANEHPVLQRGAVALLSGGGGVGKSWAALWLGYAVATGEDWCGWQTRPDGQWVLYLGAEDGPHMLHRRLQAIAGEGADVTAGGRLLAVSLVDAGAGGCALVEREQGTRRFHASETAEALAALIRAEAAKRGGPAALVIVDPGSRFLGPDAETDPGGATAGIEALSALGAAAGGACVLALLHNTKEDRQGKGSADGIRGSSALHDGARAVLTLHTEAQGFAKLTHRKCNDGPPAPAVFLQREGGGRWDRVDQVTYETQAGQDEAERRRRKYIHATERELAASERARVMVGEDAPGTVATGALCALAGWKGTEPPWVSAALFEALAKTDADAGTVARLKEVEAWAATKKTQKAQAAPAAQAQTPRAPAGARTQKRVEDLGIPL